MRPWEAQRSSREAPGFDLQIASCGLDQKQVDAILPDIEEVLCGVDLDKLDAAYPQDKNGFRLLLTDPVLDVPALRIAFCLDTDGAIYYLAIALRDAEG